MQTLLNDPGLAALIYLLVVAFVTSIIHGATGIAGGFLLAVAAAPVLGVKELVPVLSLTLLISHGFRALFNMRMIDRSSYLAIVLPAVPFIIFAALIYGRLSSAAIAFFLGTIVLLSIPARRWMKNRQFVVSKNMLRGSGAVYGSIAGAAIGPGMLLVPVLLGAGLGRQAFVATLAAIALTTNIIRISVYGMTDLFSGPYVIVGILMGLATIPGAWIGRTILRNSTEAKHATMVEWLIVLGGLNFYWLGWRTIGSA